MMDKISRRGNDDGGVCLDPKQEKRKKKEKPKINNKCVYKGWSLLS